MAESIVSAVAPQARFPSHEALARALAVFFGGEIEGRVRVEIQSPDSTGADLASRRVRCWLPGGAFLDVLCKRGALGSAEAVAIREEHRTYRTILEVAPQPTPRLLGCFEDDSDQSLWLFIEDPGGEWLADLDEPGSALAAAATWIGAFHAHGAGLARNLRPGLPGAYDADRYRGGLQRMLAALSGREREVPWLAQLTQRFDELVAPLLVGERTVIHGAYRGERIVRRGFRVFPVDWDEAALAPGEIDLASLCEGVAAADVRRCTQRYFDARGAGAWRAGFERRLAAARLYVCADRIGQRRVDPSPRSRLEVHECLRLAQLRSDALRLGLLT